MEICTRPVPGEEEVEPWAWSSLPDSFLHAQGALEIPKDVGKGAHRGTLLIVANASCRIAIPKPCPIPASRPLLPRKQEQNHIRSTLSAVAKFNSRLAKSNNATWVGDA
jgi:hypothetical protein